MSYITDPEIVYIHGVWFFRIYGGSYRVGKVFLCYIKGNAEEIIRKYFINTVDTH